MGHQEKIWEPLEYQYVDDTMDNQQQEQYPLVLNQSRKDYFLWYEIGNEGRKMS